MSGIGVIFHRNGRLAKRDEIEKMARALRIYGPERLVFKLVGPVAFAYAHMSNTPESLYDDQPLQSRDGRLTLVFDGRLDNRDDIRSDLNISSAEAATMSDGRLALVSLEKHSENAPQHWVGDFAFIAWDKREGVLYAARDVLGRRVLNWHEAADRIVIGSAAKGIFALGVPKEIDEQKVADALGQLYFDQTRSFFKNIQRLPHAKLLVATKDSVRFSTYWSVFDIPSVRFKTDTEYVEAAWEQLDKAVKSLLRSHGPVGAFMSGGWDSSTVAITATKFLEPKDAKLPVFTSVPERAWDGGCLEGEYGDETSYVRAIAQKHPRIELNLVSAEGLNQYHLRDEYINAAEAPPRNALNLCWIHEIQTQAKIRGITTLLEGTMGNMTLTWHGADVSWEWLRNGQWGRMLRHWWALYGGRKRSLLRFLPRAVWHEIVAAQAPEWMWRLYSSRFEKPLSGPRWRRFSGINPDFADGMSLEKRARQYGFKYFDRSRYFTRADRLSMLTTSVMNEVGPIYQGSGIL